MTSRSRLIIMSYLLLMLLSAQIAAQMIFVKTAFCIVWSASFVAANCAPCERLLCRMLASRIKQYCRSYPCTHYGSPSSNFCTSNPIGCRPWRIKPLGLCQPFKHCCDPKSGIDSKVNTSTNLSDLVFNSQREPKTIKRHPQKRGNLKFTTNYHVSINADSSSNGDFDIRSKDEQFYHFYTQYLRNQTEPHSWKFGSFRLPSTPEEYMKDWPEIEDDPSVMEDLIKQQYNKLIFEMNVINEDEMNYGGKAVRIPSLQEFRSVARGESPIAPW